MYDKMMKLERTKERWIKAEREKLEVKLLEPCTFKPKISRLKKSPGRLGKKETLRVQNIGKHEKMAQNTETMNRFAEPDDS